MIDVNQYADELLDVSKECIAMYVQRLALANATIKALQNEIEELKRQVFND